MEALESGGLDIKRPMTVDIGVRGTCRGSVDDDSGEWRYFGAKWDVQPTSSDWWNCRFDGFPAIHMSVKEPRARSAVPGLSYSQFIRR